MRRNWVEVTIAAVALQAVYCFMCSGHLFLKPFLPKTYLERFSFLAIIVCQNCNSERVTSDCDCVPPFPHFLPFVWLACCHSSYDSVLWLRTGLLQSLENYSQLLPLGCFKPTSSFSLNKTYQIQKKRLPSRKLMVTATPWHDYPTRGLKFKYIITTTALLSKPLTSWVSALFS